MQHFILATAGHVDHGKSSVVKALTGTDPDRLPEEKARGITIDLGFACLDLAADNSAAPAYRLGIIDVPGHEDFVNNMVAGVGSIDLALLVVAADDGWMPQTEEHLQILEYLQVPRGLVALTKSDLLPGPVEPSIADVRGHLTGTFLEPAPVIPTSVRTGAGLQQLRHALLDVLLAATPPRDAGKPRLPVDRVFTLHGIGTVATGTLAGGTLTRGQSITIQPGGHSGRIRSLQNHSTSRESCGPGMRVAVNIPDLVAAAREDKAPSAPNQTIRRGDVITIAGLGPATRTVNVWITKSGRASATPLSRPIKHLSQVRVHFGTSHCRARVLFADRDALLPGEGSVAQLRFEQPVFVLAGDRLVIRDAGSLVTLGGALVCEVDARRRTFRTEPEQAFLHASARAGLDPEAWIIARLTRDQMARRDTLLTRSIFALDEITRATANLVAAGRARLVGHWCVDAGTWEALINNAIATVDRAHAEHPERRGMALIEFRAQLRPQLADDALFEHFLEALRPCGIARAGAEVGRIGHRTALPAPLAAAAERLRARLLAKPTEPPSRRELCPDAASMQALKFLLEHGDLVAIGPDVVLLRETYETMTQQLRGAFASKESLTVSELRVILGTTRRIAVPLVEHWDARGLTIREGDRRRLA